MSKTKISGEPKARNATEILLIDDDPGTARLLTLAFDEADGQMKTLIATDETEAREILPLTQNEISTQIPAVVVVNIDNNGFNGRNVLHAIDEREELDTVPVIVFSREDDPAIVKECYELGATLYMVKSDDYRGLKRIANAVSTCIQAAKFAE